MREWDCIERIDYDYEHDYEHEHDEGSACWLTVGVGANRRAGGARVSFQF